MGHKARVVSISLPDRGRFPTQEQLIELVVDRIRDVGSLKPDLICLPEEVLIMSGDKNNPRWQENNQRLLALLQEEARQLSSNIVCCLEMPAEAYPGKRYNRAYVIGRQGEILGQYNKRHITFRAFPGGGLPGERLVVCETDIGRIGLMICFDIGWRDDWRKLKEMGAELVVWPSAYDGGFLLNAYAAVHQYFIVSSVADKRGRIIDPFGQELAASSRWDGVAAADIHLGTEVFHMDRQHEKISELRRALGDTITIRVQDDDNLFYLASCADDWPMERIKKEFGLMTYDEYHQEATRDNEAALQEYPEV